MPSRSRAIGVTAACAALGVIGGIAGAAAAPSSQSKTTRHSAQATTGPARPGGPGFGAGGPVVHEDAVILDTAGTGFINATIDNGTVDSVSGNTLSLKEGIGTVTYKTVALTIPGGATIVRNFKTAALSDLKSGDHVHVTQSSDGTMVFADDGTMRPPAGSPGDGHRHFGGPYGGPGGPDGGWGRARPMPPSGSGSTTTTTTSTT